jgi:hypothetical protein
MDVTYDKYFFDFFLRFFKVGSNSPTFFILKTTIGILLFVDLIVDEFFGKKVAIT